jgi:predicted 2-oxoglutarate/Fe(II)-dependent dioxygenase YbiX
MVVEAHNSFWVVRNVISEEQISDLIRWWEEQPHKTTDDGTPEVYKVNKWDNTSKFKQTIDNEHRKTTVVGLKHKTFGFLEDMWSSIFQSVYGKPLQPEGPTYFNKYVKGGKHKIHKDVAKGYKNRKLISVIQLSEPSDYEGGFLRIKDTNGYISAPKEKGCAVVYKNDTLHCLSRITSGVRYSMNECASEYNN